jgi:signal transduction histidine kinase/FixJ family two-component response regulator
MSDRPRVLIVYDDEPTRTSLALIFNKNGYESEGIGTGGEALERVEESFFNIALVDSELPDMEGVELLASLKECHPDMAVLLVASHPSAEMAVRALNEGASALITRPLNVEDVLTKMGEALEQQRVVMEGRRLVETANHELAELKGAEQTLQQRNRELAMLNRASQALASTLDLDQVLVSVLEEVRRLLGIVACSIWLIDPETGELVCRQSAGPQSELVRGFRLAPGQGLAGWVAQSGETLVVADTHADERYFKGVDKQTGLMLRSILSVPLRAKRGVIGVLQVTDTQTDRFDETHLALIEPLTASAAIAITNAELIEALRRRTAELEARNEELDAFAHTAAHDLKGPLGYIVGFAKVLAQDYATMPEEQLSRYLQTIARSGSKMGDIIDALLLLASAHKLEDVELRPLEMADIVDEALQRLAFMVDQYQAEIVLPDAWPLAMGYGPWVEEVWVNYISNALKYGGQPPRVELGATTQADGTLRFWVRDNGVGLTPEEQARLFTPFTRFDQVRAKGHGLGLSIVRRIVEKLGGEVGIESEVGQGSTFSFTLPASG